MTYETTVKRNRDGLEAETRIPLGFDRRELRITTSKGSRGVYTGALVVQVTDRGFTFVLCQDYRKTLAQDKAARATEKTIRTMHAAVLANVDAVVAEAKAFYDKVPA